MTKTHHCPHCGANLVTKALRNPSRSIDVIHDTANAPLQRGASIANDPTLAYVASPNDPTVDAPVEAQYLRRAEASSREETGARNDLSGDLVQSFESRPQGSNPPGTRLHYFGDYEIVRELGRGGMGVVFEARQVSLNRPVALKLIKAGVLANDAELRRFQNEAEAVALLDHPGIVSAYEVGQHQGQQYLAMKLVRGESLNALQSTFKDHPRRAAGLVAEAAEAVAHAHSRGILHRDLKPANILVDDQGHPHILDFGLAKRLEADMGMTATGAILGTPAFMAPEQASGGRDQASTATDVYGLGAVLYALLTGRAPFTSDSIFETLDALRTRPPDSPTRINSSAPRDLETICLKCLEKDPRRRYGSAQALADDLRAWLESRPISARRVGPSERAWLWAKRRPAIAALTAATLLAVFGGTCAVIGIQRQANSALRSKNDELTQAIGREAKANAELSVANDRVEQRYQLAMDAIKTFHTGVSEDFLLKEPAFQQLRDRLLESASAFYQKLSNLLEASTDLASKQALLDSSYELADLAAKIGRLEESLAVHRNVLTQEESLASAPDAMVSTEIKVGRSMRAVLQLLKKIGSKQEVSDMQQRALEYHERAASKHPDEPEIQNGLASMLMLHGEHLKNVENRREESEQAFKRCLDILKSLSRSHPDSVDYLVAQSEPITFLCNLRADEGKFDEAIQIYQEVIELARRRLDEHPEDVKMRSDLATCEEQLSLWHGLAKRKDESIACSREAARIWQSMVDREPAVPSHQYGLANSLNQLAQSLFDNESWEEAEKTLRTALAMYAKLNQERPNDVQLRKEIANGHNTLANFLMRFGRMGEAKKELRSALASQRQLVDEEPSDHDMRESLALVHLNLGRMLIHSDPEQAEVEFLEAIKNFEQVVLEQPSIVFYRMRLSTSLRFYGNLLEQTHRPDEAVTQLRKSLTVRGEIPHTDPTALWLFDENATVHNELGGALRAAGNVRESLEEYDQAIAIREDLTQKDPKNKMFQSHLAWSLRRRGLVRESQGDLTGAAADYQRAVATLEGILSRDGTEWLEMALAHASLSTLANTDGAPIDKVDVDRHFQASLTALRQAVEQGNLSPEVMWRDPMLTAWFDRPEVLACIEKLK